MLEGTENVLEITDQKKRVEMLVCVVMLSETMVNRNTEEEAGFIFFKKEFSKLRALMKRTFEALKTYHNTGTPALSDDTHFFLSELLESLTYLILDFSINETTNATQLQFSYPIKKSEAKETLLFANEMVAFYLQFMDHKKSVELDTRER